MTSVQQGTLQTPGASIFYRSCGRGPPVLILAGGDADADATDPLRDALAERHRVITYDRRGLSRSRPDPGAPTATIADHAQDAHRLLAEMTDEPAFVFGSSIGGLIGLDLVARHPSQVRLLVAHEAPTKELLPEAEEAQMTAAQEAMRAAYAEAGISAALKKNAQLAGLDPEDREPDVTTLVPLTPQREANLRVLLGDEAAQVMAYRLDLPAIDIEARRIAPAAGRSTRRTLLHRCARALSEVLERPLEEFPGGHTGWLLRPKAFAARLEEAFAEADRPRWLSGDAPGVARRWTDDP